MCVLLTWPSIKPPTGNEVIYRNQSMTSPCSHRLTLTDGTDTQSTDKGDQPWRLYILQHSSHRNEADAVSLPRHLPPSSSTPLKSVSGHSGWEERGHRWAPVELSHWQETAEQLFTRLMNLCKVNIKSLQGKQTESLCVFSPTICQICIKAFFFFNFLCESRVNERGDR